MIADYLLNIALTTLVESAILLYRPLWSIKGVFDIYDHFASISPEKQARIINAAYKEFAHHGYKKASTNRIVENAGIGKGMLFHYFGSKQGLYNYLFEYAVSFFEEYFGKIEEQASGVDYIEWYRIASKIKLEAYLKSPCIFEFFTKVYFSPEELSVLDNAKKMHHKILAMRTKAFTDLNKNIDMTGFRTDIDPQRLKNYITWCFDGYTQQLLAGFKGKNLSDIDLVPYWAEFDKILDDLKTLYYKQHAD